LEAKLDQVAETVTKDVFNALEGELSITDWENKGQVKKAMRVKIKGVLRGKVEPGEIEPLTASVMDRIQKN
jgi:hypothetical protein